MTAETASPARSVDWRTHAASIRAALVTVRVWLRAVAATRPVQAAARPAVWARQALRLLGVGLWTAPTEYHRWRLATDYDEAIAIAKDAKDQTKAIIGQDRKDAAIAARSLATARASRIAVAIGFGGWIWATLGLALAAAAAGVLYARAEKDPKAAACPKARQFARLRHALTALGVSAGLWCLNAARGYAPGPVHLGNDGEPPAVRLALALKGAGGFDAAWSPVLLWWPGVSLAAAAAVLIVWARDGSVGNDLPDPTMAPAIDDDGPVTNSSLERAINESVPGLDAGNRDKVARLVEPGIMPAANGQSWSVDIDFRGIVPAELMVGPKVRNLLASKLKVGSSHLFPVVHDDNAARGTLTVITGRPFAVPVTSPLLHLDRVDLWNPPPFFGDIQGNSHVLPIAFNNIGIGGMPDFGKSTTLNCLIVMVLLGGGKVRCIDGGEVDTEPFHKAGLVKEWCTSPTDAIDLLQDYVKDINAVQSELAEVGKKKVDPEFFELTGRNFDLLAWDELEAYTNHPDPKVRNEIRRLANDAISRSRKAGKVIAWATQSVSAEGVDSNFRDKTIVRDRKSVV